MYDIHYEIYRQRHAEMLAEAETYRPAREQKEHRQRWMLQTLHREARRSAGRLIEHPKKHEGGDHAQNGSHHRGLSRPRVRARP